MHSSKAYLIRGLPDKRENKRVWDKEGKCLNYRQPQAKW